MKQFDLYENPDSDSHATYPFFVDVQTDLLDDLNSRVVISTSPVQDAKKFP
ncbi:CcdB family protein, partial [Spongiibacter marinus]|uniref:CcdB family protein n=1 Tax=Spongiibacter marinus TaxID=354246 RepID=UPI000559C411